MFKFVIWVFVFCSGTTYLFGQIDPLPEPCNIPYNCSWPEADYELWGEPYSMTVNEGESIKIRWKLHDKRVQAALIDAETHSQTWLRFDLTDPIEGTHEWKPEKTTVYQFIAGSQPWARCWRRSEWAVRVVSKVNPKKPHPIDGPFTPVTHKQFESCRKRNVGHCVIEKPTKSKGSSQQK
jgi:hypothetical protein